MVDSATSPAGPSGDLLHYLQQSRDAVLRALEGLSEYDARRPLTPSGTNMLGVVKHLTGVEASYLGDCSGRPSPVLLPWVEDGSVWDGADMWVTADESRDYILGLYHATWVHSDASVSELSYDSAAYVEWWSEGRRETTFGHLLVRVVADTAQHAGHLEVLREGIDGRGGRDHDDLGDSAYWEAYVGRIQAAAEVFEHA